MVHLKDSSRNCLVLDGPNLGASQFSLVSPPPARRAVSKPFNSKKKEHLRENEKQKKKVALETIRKKYLFSKTNNDLFTWLLALVAQTNAGACCSRAHVLTTHVLITDVFITHGLITHVLIT